MKVSWAVPTVFGIALILIFSLENAMGQQVGDPCEDGNACTTTGVFDGDVCRGGPPVVCDDGDFCTIDNCNPAVGCFTIPNTCTDFNACTTDSCDTASQSCSNTEIICDDNNACTRNTCDPFGPAFGGAPNGCKFFLIDCDDGDVCTADFCTDIVTGCASTPILCDDNNTCTADSCVPNLGCEFVAIPACFPDDSSVIGGEIIPIETTSLILAGAQTFSWMIPVVLSVLGIGLFVVSRKSE